MWEQCKRFRYHLVFSCYSTVGHLSEEAKEWLVYIIRTLTSSNATFLTTSSSLSGAAVNLASTPSHTVVAALTIPNIYASPSSVQHLALATQEDPVVPVESGPAVVAAAVGGSGDNTTVGKPPAKEEKVFMTIGNP